MGTYNSAVITNGGQSMIAQAVAGASLEFTTIKTSNYAYPAGTNLATLTTINGIKQSKDITSAAVYNSRVIKISAAVDNTGISTAYAINTIGIYAKVGSSAESLFAVVTASAADTMPAYDSKPYSYIYEINLTMQNAANVTVTVNAAGLVNVADLNAAKVEIQGEIADLKSALTEINNLDMKKVIESSSLSNTTRIEIYFDTIPKGTNISISFDSLQSSDVDATKSLILIGYNGEGVTYPIKRNFPFVLNKQYPNDINCIFIYASSNYSKSVGDTVSVSNLAVKKTNNIIDFVDSAVGGKTNSYGARTELYSSDFLLENRVRTANTLFASYHLQSCIYVAEKKLYYATGNTGDGNSILVALENFNSINTPLNTLNLAMGHCNDMTYNADNGLIYIAHGGGNKQEGNVTRNGVHVINPSDFSDNYEIIISDLTEVYGIEYYDGFFYIRDGYSIYKYKIVNNTFVRIGLVAEVPVKSIIYSVCGEDSITYGVYQTITIRDDTLYFLIGFPSGSNKTNIDTTIIAKINLNSGKTTGVLAFKNWNFSECESLIFIGENAYVVSAQRTYFIDIYKTNMFATYRDNIGYKLLNANADLNTVLAYGKYVCDSNVIDTLQNAPSGLSGASAIFIEVKQIMLANMLQKITAKYATKPPAEYSRIIASNGAIYGWE